MATQSKGKRSSGSARKPATAKRASSGTSAKQSAEPSSNGSARGTIVRGALAAAGTAALGAAGTILIKERQRPRGMHMPRHVAPKIDPRKLANGLDLKHVVKQIGDAAEQIEARSEDVRMLSAQAKRLSRKLS